MSLRTVIPASRVFSHERGQFSTADRILFDPYSVSLSLQRCSTISCYSHDQPVLKREPFHQTTPLSFRTGPSRKELGVDRYCGLSSSMFDAEHKRQSGHIRDYNAARQVCRLWRDARDQLRTHCVDRRGGEVRNMEEVHAFGPECSQKVFEVARFITHFYLEILFVD